MSVEYKFRGDASPLNKTLTSVEAKEKRLEQQTIRTKQGFDRLNASAIANAASLRRANLATQKITASELKFAASTKVATAGLVNQRRVTTGLAARIGALRNQLLLFSFATVAVTAGLKKLVSESSKLKESINAVGVVFGSAKKEVLEFGKTADRSVGLANAEFNQLVTVTGALLKGIGLPMREVAELTIKLTKRAADMASVYDKDVSEALNAINSSLRGQTEPITRFAVNTQIAALEAVALAKGIDESVKAMNQQEKRLLVIDAIMQQTADTQGDFTKTQKSFANAGRILISRLSNIAATIGDDMLPPLERFIDVLNKLTVESGPLQKLGTRMQDIGRKFADANPLLKIYLDFLGVLKDKIEETEDPMDVLLRQAIELNKELKTHKKNVFDFIVKAAREAELAAIRRLATERRIAFFDNLKKDNSKIEFKAMKTLSETQLTLTLQRAGLTREEHDLQMDLFRLQGDKNLLEEASNALTTRKLKLVKEVTSGEIAAHVAALDAGDATRGISEQARIAAQSARAIAGGFLFALQHARSLQEAIKGIAFTLLNIGVNRLFSPVPGFAHGTSFAPGGPAVVGERGPEIVNLPRGSQVTPNQTFNNSFGGITIHNAGGELDASEVANAINRAVDAGLRVKSTG